MNAKFGGSEKYSHLPHIQKIISLQAFVEPF